MNYVCPSLCCQISSVECFRSSLFFVVSTESFNEAKHQWFLDFYRQIALLDRGSTKAKPAVVILKTVVRFLYHLPFLCLSVCVCVVVCLYVCPVWKIVF